MASLVQIWSTLALFVIMAAEMGQAQQCGGKPPVKGLYSNPNGICYIQQASTSNGCASYNCGFYTISNSDDTNGNIFFQARFPVIGDKSVTFNYMQVNKNFSLYQPNVTTPYAHVNATNTETNEQFVHSIVFNNTVGKVIYVCSSDDITKFKDAFVCTYKQQITPKQLKTFAQSAKKAGIDVKSMASTSQTKCG